MQHPTSIQKDAKVARERSRVTRDIDNPAGSRLKRGEGSHDGPPGALARWVEHREVHIAETLSYKSSGYGAFEHLHVRQISRVPRSVGTCPTVSLHCEHRTALADDITDEPRKKACSCIQIGHAISRPYREPVQHGPTKEASCAGMHLPEDPRTHLVVTFQDLEGQSFGLTGHAPVHN